MLVATAFEVLLVVLGSAVPDPTVALLEAVPTAAAVTTRVTGLAAPAASTLIVQVSTEPAGAPGASGVQGPLPVTRAKVVLVGMLSVTVTVSVVSLGPRLVAVIE